MQIASLADCHDTFTKVVRHQAARLSNQPEMTDLNLSWQSLNASYFVSGCSTPTNVALYNFSGVPHKNPGPSAREGAEGIKHEPVEVADELVAEEGFATPWQAHQDDDQLLPVGPLPRASGARSN